MARSHGISVQNKFIKGLITEATALSFPEDACTETYNCVFSHKGRVTRRLGIDLEGGHSNTALDLTGAAIVTYQWKNVGGDGDLNYVVVQIGQTLYFYKVSSSNPVSGLKHANTIDLTTFLAPTAPTAINLECQFSQGNGYLFVTNQFLQPFYVTYSIIADTFTATAISMQIRDFVGITSDVSDTQRPTTLSAIHRYNLGNQGWPSGWLGASATSITIGTGSKTFTMTNMPDVGTVVGDRVRVYSRATPGSLGPSINTGNIMIGTVTSIGVNTVTVNVTATNGAGTFTDWNMVAEPDNIEAWNILYGNYPSNCDVWWVYKNTSNLFAPSTEFMNKIAGNTPAPKGHYLLNVFSEDRAVAASISTLAVVDTSVYRPTTSAFFAGRVFYAGIQWQGYNARIYFSQIIDNINKVGRCYEQNDPTSEDLFDLLPTDGGFVDILEAGTILKMVPVLNALVIICTNGIWIITGSQGLGFAANDYSIHKISAVPSVSAASLVEVDGMPVWWTNDGIFTIQTDSQTGQFSAKNIVGDSILSFFQDIPIESRRFARGTYDPEDHKIHWVYKSVVSTSFADKYTYDRMLTLNLLSNAWFPWSVSTNIGHIHGVVAVRAQGGTYTLSQVTAASGVNTVKAAAGANNVIAFIANNTNTGNSGTLIKYLVSYENAGTQVTFGECYQTSYMDWSTVDNVGEDFTSYFITGHRIHGEAMRKFQTNYVNFFSDADAEDTQFKVRGQWDFSTSGSSGRDSTVQTVSGLFKARPKRLKIRGHGKSMQFRIESITGQPFSLIGWSAFETANPWI